MGNFLQTLKRYSVSKQQVVFHQLPKSNVLLVCDDDSYKKSLFNAIKNKVSDDHILEDASQNELDFLDFQTNVLTQVKTFFFIFNLTGLSN